MAIQNATKNGVLINNFLMKENYYQSLSLDYKPEPDLKNIVNPDNIDKMGIYYRVMFSKPIPNQGWKIHISAIPSNARKVLSICDMICSAHQVSYKFMCDRAILSFSVSKAWPRNESGKFITIYPASDDEFVKIIEELYTELKEFEGPYILSDKRYRANCHVVYYRYGGFKLRYMLKDLGQLVPAIADNKGEMHPDIRGNVYTQPAWVQNPIKDETASQKNKQALIFNDRYRVVSAIAHTSSGGVYRGLDIVNSENVVIKESRPNTLTNLNTKEDAVTARKREWLVLKELDRNGLTCIPRPLAAFTKWENYYLVESTVSGQDLQTFDARFNPLAFSGLYENRLLRTKELRSYLSDLREILVNLTKAVLSLHSCGVYIGDLSTFNVMLSENHSIVFPDLEGAGFIEHPSAFINYTPGFMDENKAAAYDKVMADNFALGSVMLSMVLPVNYEFKINKMVVKSFTIRMNNELNLPRQFTDVILQLIYHPKDISLEKVVNLLKAVDFSEVMIESPADAHSQKKLNASNNEIKEHFLSEIPLIGVNHSVHGDAGRPNQFSLGNGLAGLIHYLYEQSMRIPLPLIDQLKACIPNVSELGLFNGLCGIA